MDKFFIANFVRCEYFLIPLPMKVSAPDGV